MFALKRTSLGSVLDCVAPCLEESLLSLAKLRLEEVWKSFTEHTKRVDVWLKNDSEKRSVIFLRGFHKWVLEEVLPLPGVRGRLESELGAKGGGWWGRVDADCEE